MLCALKQAANSIVAIRQTGGSAKILSKMPAELNFLGLFNWGQRRIPVLLLFIRK